MDDFMQMFSLLASPLGFIMGQLYWLLGNYGWTIIIFTVIIRLAIFPLTIKQQKSTARMSAFQPMIKEIQKKWANDKNKQNAEMQKFYEENNLKMTAGCLPMLVNMLVLFGIIAVIQAPLEYMLHMPPEQIQSAGAIVESYDPESNISTNTYTQQSILIGEMRKPENYTLFTQGADGVEITDADGKTVKAQVKEEWMKEVENFNFDFIGMDLSKVPTRVDQSELVFYLILPILSVLTMFASQFIIMKTGGSAAGGGQMKGTMMVFTIVTGVWFGYIAFTVPVGFSLYYATGNVVMTIQQFVVKRMYDPEKIRAEVEQEIEERKKLKKAKKKVTIQEQDGQVLEIEATESELNKIRLIKAREQDAEKYGEIDASDELAKGITEKARKIDEEKYKSNGIKSGGEPAGEGKEETSEEDEKALERPGDRSLENTEDNSEEIEENDQEQKPYRPGRRKRARDNKRDESSQPGEDSEVK